MSTILNLLLHLHQPDYRPAAGGPALLPWVRLHAVRGYTDLLSMLEKHSGPKCCVNFSGILIEQLNWHVARSAAGEPVDEWAALAVKPAGDWTADERAYALRLFFSAHYQNMIRPLPRYWELLQRREQLLTAMDPLQAQAEFSVQDFTDLALLFNLCWLGFSQQGDSLPQGLRRQGRGFETAQIQALLKFQLEVLSYVLPRYRALAQAGHIEISVTPYQHPILPLLCDLQANGHVREDDPLPVFMHMDDATLHVQRGLELARAAFGDQVVGLWPAEGSISDQVLQLFSSEGIAWCATDQANLPRQDGDALAHASPQRWSHGGRPVTVFFRDTRLSDNIGFVYASWPPRNAVDHFCEMLASLGRLSGKDQPVVTVALDGENPWEQYSDGAEAFLDNLFQRLKVSEDPRALLPSEIAELHDWPQIDHVRAGSWIHGNFNIWSRHAETREAWRLLAEARSALDGQFNLPEVQDALLAAEGSDWFWWYGDDFASASPEVFDELFRSHLKQAYLAAGQEPPAKLDYPICRAFANVGLRESEQLLDVTLDGRDSDYFEWLGANQASIASGQGSMAQSADLAFTALKYGFSQDALLLRIDLEQSWLAAAASEGLNVSVSLTHPDEDFECSFQLQPANGAEMRSHSVGCQAVLLQLLEIAIPLDAAGLAHDSAAWMLLELSLTDGSTCRFPVNGRLGLRVITRDFALRHWRV